MHPKQICKTSTNNFLLRWQILIGYERSNTVVLNQEAMGRLEALANFYEGHNIYNYFASYTTI